MNLQETIDAIRLDGELQQRLGDQAVKDGLNEKAATYYARAKVAREEGLLLQGNSECSDPERCYEIQELIKSADQYKLVKWGLTEPPPC
jgi:hypothetical protein